MKAKYWIGLLVALLVISNAFWFYQSVDSGISLTYARSNAELTVRTLDAAVRLANMNLVGIPLETALRRIEADSALPAPFEKKTERCVVVAQLCVRYSADRTINGISAN